MKSMAAALPVLYAILNEVNPDGDTNEALARLARTIRRRRNRRDR